MMRQGNGGPNKRGRGRNGGGGPGNGGGGNRRPNGGMPNRMATFDSNGPEVRIRGNAYQVHEKYLTLARDATAAGDRIMAENFYQHAEHYYRIINAEGYGPDDRRPPRGPEGGYMQGQQQPMQAPIPGEEPQPDMGNPAPQQQAEARRTNQQQQQAPQGGDDFSGEDEYEGADHQPG